MSIWTEPSRYGTCSGDTKSVSTSTVRRWAKEHRIKTRRSQSLRLQLSQQPRITDQSMRTWLAQIA